MRALFPSACALMLAGSLTAAAAPLKTISDMHGRPAFPLGANYAWKDWGKDFNAEGWDERLKKIRSDMDAMAVAGVNTLRWWIYTDFVDSPLWKGKGRSLRCTGLPKGWVANFVTACTEAQKRGIRLYPVFSSFDLGRKGFKWVVSDKAVRKSFIEKAVRPILKAAGRHEGVLAWDIINEPEWLVRTEDGGDPNKELSDGPVSLAELRAYLADMAKEVHKHANQPVSVGSAAMKWCGKQFDFYSGLGLDFYDIHYYDWQTPWFNITQIGPADFLPASEKGKAVIIGETIPKPETQYTGPGKPKHHGRMLEDTAGLGYAGYLTWAWNEKEDLDCRASIGGHFRQFLKDHPLAAKP